MYYGARYYDAALGRFVQPDTIIPNVYNPQSLNRYSYVLNNPLRYTDPTGHMEADPGSGALQPCYFPGNCLRVVEPPAETKDQKDQGLPSYEKAFDIYYGRLCGLFCELTLRIAPPALKARAMLLVDDNGSFGDVRYRPITEEDTSQFVGMWFSGYAALTAPVEVGGEFSIYNWSDYPISAKPNNPVRLVEDAEYDAALAAKNAANRAIHNADPTLKGQHIHEVQPVKLGGSPTDPANKIVLSPEEHYTISGWWNSFLARLRSGR